MSNVIDFAGFHLNRLGPETWGDRMKRARERADLTVRDVERYTGSYISRSAVSRLEALDAVPVKTPDRRKATFALLLYRVDPRDFGLGPDDVPPLLDIDAVTQANVTNLCFSGGQLFPAGDTPDVAPLAA